MSDREMIDQSLHAVELAALRDAATDAEKASRDPKAPVVARIVMRATAKWLRQRADRRQTEGPYRS